MGFMTKIRRKFMAPEERKFFDEALEKEKAAAQRTARIQRKDELAEMARIEALPKEQRVARKLRRAREGLSKAGQKVGQANETAKKLSKKFDVGGGMIKESMKGSGGGKLRESMLGKPGKTAEKMGRGKTIKITFE